MKNFQITPSAKRNFMFFLLLMGFFVRIFMFGTVPPGLNTDEASIGYEAFSILNYGIDRHGVSYPVYFIAEGDGQNALYSYMVMPFISWLGLNEITIRLPNLILGLLSLWIFYLLLKKITTPAIALWGLFLLAISPWHIMASRWALDCNIFPPIFLIAVYLLVMSVERNWLFLAACTLFGFSLYAYAPSIIVIPLFLTLSGIYFYRHAKLSLLSLLGGFFLFLLASFPIILFLIINFYGLPAIKIGMLSIPKLLFTGFHDISFLQDDFIHALLFCSDTFIKLLIYQHDNMLSNTIPAYGAIYLFSLFFSVIGFGACTIRELLIRKRCFNIQRIMLLWAFVSIILGISMESTIYHINIIFFPLIYFTAEGLVLIIKCFQNLNTRLTMAIIGILVYLVSFGSFSFYYFTEYPQKLSLSFHESLNEAISYATNLKETEEICITNKINQPYIYVLFYKTFSPHTFIKTVKYVEASEKNGMQLVASFDKYRFYDISLSKNKVYIAENADLNAINDPVVLNNLVIKRFKNYSVFYLKNSF